MGQWPLFSMDNTSSSITEIYTDNIIYDTGYNNPFTAYAKIDPNYLQELLNELELPEEIDEDNMPDEKTWEDMILKGKQ